MPTRDDCLTKAREAGFNNQRAVQVCDVAQGETQYGSTNACACAKVDGGPIFHDAECDALGLTKHCGVFQMAVTDPAFAPIIQSGCAFDLGCALKAMFGLTQGGACFDHANPWGPHFGKPYGVCGGQADPAVFASAPAECKACGIGDIGACLKCGFSNAPGPFGVGGVGGSVGGAFDALGKLKDLLALLWNPNLYYRAAILIGGVALIDVGLHALAGGD